MENSQLISCICLTFGRPQQLGEAIECFLRQKCSWPRELVVYNTCPHQTLCLDDLPPGAATVRIFNAQPRPKSLGEARNLAIAAARGNVLVTWDDDDLYLDHYLESFVTAWKAHPEAQWVWQNLQFYAEGGKIQKLTSGTCNTFAFTREAWERAGRYHEGANVGEDRALITRITKTDPGHHCTFSPHEAGFIYCWGNGAHHISGQGADKAGHMNAWRRAELALEGRFRNGTAIRGSLTISPKLFQDYEAMAKSHLSRYPVEAHNPEATAVVLLGRYGDIINILPVCKHLHDEGKDPHLIVAREFASVLDGVSYVKPVVLDVPFDQLTYAMDYAKQRFKHVIRAQIYGIGHKQATLCPSYNMESWREAGFLGKFHDPNWKPVFDLFDATGEKILSKLFKTNKPKIVTNLTAARTAPFPRGPQVLQELVRTFGKTHEVVDVGRLRLSKIYELLPILKAAELIVSIDTATLHLAAATNVPVVALVNDTIWVGSTVRYNCAASLCYRVASSKAVCDAVSRVLRGGPKQRGIALAALNRDIPQQGRKRLKGVTLWACVWSDDHEMQFRTLRVLRYCQTLFEFDDVLFLSFLPVPKHAWKMRLLQVPNLAMHGWSIFHNRIVPNLIKTPFALSVHEDGFPIRPDLWNDQFLEYDFIGAPWANGGVGNSGFALESQRFLQAKAALPFDDLRGYGGLTGTVVGNHTVTHSDVFATVLHREALIARGLKIAPVETALEFSTEQTGKQWPSFGFHGRNDQPEKYAEGWEQIEASEQP